MVNNVSNCFIRKRGDRSMVKIFGFNRNKPMVVPVFHSFNDKIKIFNVSEELNLDEFEFISIEEAEAIQKEYGIEVINEDQLSDFQPLWWHIIGRVVRVGSSYVVKVGTRIFTKHAPETATAALRSFTPIYLLVVAEL